MDLNIFRTPKSAEDAAALQKTQKLFFWISIGVFALIATLGSSLMSGLGGMLLPLIAVPFLIWLGGSAFAANHVESFKQFHCACGESVTYNEDVTYHLTKTPKKYTDRNKDSQDITTSVYVDLIIDYTCPKCQQTRRYSTPFCLERMVQNAHGVVLEHNKYSLTKEDVKEALTKRLYASRLIEDSQV